MHLIFLSIVIFLSVACSPGSLEEFHYEGEGVVWSLAHDLEEVQTLDDLIAISGRVKKKLALLVDWTVKAEAWQKRHKEEQAMPLSREASDFLQQQLTRIYQIEGGRAKMEELERESLHKLHRSFS